jgi:hypothetical protein
MHGPTCEHSQDEEIEGSAKEIGFLPAHGVRRVLSSSDNMAAVLSEVNNTAPR